MTAQERAAKLTQRYHDLLCPGGSTVPYNVMQENIAGALEAHAREAVRAALERAKTACEEERVEPCTGEDECYNLAVSHCVTAIDRLIAELTGGPDAKA